MVEVVGMEVVPYYLTLIILVIICSRVSAFGVQINNMMNENNGCKNNYDSCSASSSDDIIFDQCVHELELSGYAYYLCLHCFKVILLPPLLLVHSKLLDVD